MSVCRAATRRLVFMCGCIAPLGTAGRDHRNPHQTPIGESPTTFFLHQVVTALASAGRFVTADHVFVSICAGVTIATLEEVCLPHAPVNPECGATPLPQSGSAHTRHPRRPPSACQRAHRWLESCQTHRALWVPWRLECLQTPPHCRKTRR